MRCADSVRRSTGSLWRGCWRARARSWPSGAPSCPPASWRPRGSATPTRWALEPRRGCNQARDRDCRWCPSGAPRTGCGRACVNRRGAAGGAASCQCLHLNHVGAMGGARVETSELCPGEVEPAGKPAVLHTAATRRRRSAHRRGPCRCAAGGAEPRGGAQHRLAPRRPGAADGRPGQAAALLPGAPPRRAARAQCPGA